eukprot:gene2054-2532_t
MDNKIDLDQNNNKEENEILTDDDINSEYGDDDFTKDYKASFTEEEKDKLLYNDVEDEENEEWMNKNFKKITGFRSDASLSCPGCFTLLCIDSQRHDIYKNQFRAIFVKNCKIDPTKRLVYKEDNIKNNNNNNSKRKGKSSTTTTNNNNTVKEEDDNIELKIEDTSEPIVEYYYQVFCSVCDTNVAVIDNDEVYHFFNVFPS